MGAESFKKNNNEDVQKRVDLATQEADPTTYSVLPPEQMKTKIFRSFDDLNKPVRVGSGETYYQINDDPKGQQVIARLLKGIINVSDIISVPNQNGEEKYYSWKMPLEKIEQNATKEIVETDQFLFKYLFNSYDHLFNTSTNWANNARYEKEKISHFDFGEDAIYFLKNPEERESLMVKLKQKRPTAINDLKRKVSELRSRFKGESGKNFLKSIIDSTGSPVTQILGPRETFDVYSDIEPTELVYQVLVGRIDELSKLLNEIESSELN